MLIWHYDENTGELLTKGLADADPLDVGNWLIPAHATPVEPPATVQGHAAVFSDGQWGVVEDHRGEPWWDDKGHRVEIKSLGPVPAGLVNTPPPPQSAPDVEE